MADNDELQQQMSRRASETGLLVAAAAVPETFQRTLIPRADVDQAIVTGLTFALDHGIVSTLQELIQTLAMPAGDEVDGLAWHRRAMVLDAVALGVGAATHAVLPEADDEPIARSTLRTGAWILGVTGMGGLVTGGASAVGAGRGGDQGGARWELVAVAAAMAALREYGRRRRSVDDNPPDGDVQVRAGRALGLGVAVGLGATGLARLEAAVSSRVADALGAVLPGDAQWWRPAGHLASLGLFALAGYQVVRPVYRAIEAANTRFEAALDLPPTRPEVSGSPTSSIPYDSLGKMGRRMVWTLRPPVEIERVMAEPAVATPLRVYGGLELADTPRERVRRAVDELEQMGGFDRAWLLVISPTGTGYPNYAALGSMEMLARGDCASIAMQYSERPSPLSVDRVGAGREQFRMLVDEIGARLAGRATRPAIMMFGESLGAWTSQDAFLHQGTDGLVEAGIDRALWIGTPFGSKWKDEVLGGGRDDVDDRLVRVVGSVDEWDALDPAVVADLRYVMLTHHDDAVAHFDESLLVKRPAWLGPPEDRPRQVPRSQRWVPVTTFFQTLIDMKNAAQVVPGVFASRGHDYRADLPPLFAGVMGVEVTDEQLLAIRRALEAEEAVRTRWIDEHGAVGESMASALVERIRQESPEAYERAVASMRADVSGWLVDWEAREST